MLSRRLRVLTITVLITVITFGLISFPVQAQGDCADAGAMAAVAVPLIGFVNEARANSGIHAVSLNGALTAAAQRHSDDMAQNAFLSHTGSDGSTPDQRISAAGYGGSARGENVLVRFDMDPYSAFMQWWNSSGHRDNMMRTDINEMGLAVACGTFQGFSGAYYMTMTLGQGAGGDSNPAPAPQPTQPPSSGGENPAPQPTQPPGNSGENPAPQPTAQPGNGGNSGAQPGGGNAGSQPGITLPAQPAGTVRVRNTVYLRSVPVVQAKNVLGKVPYNTVLTVWGRTADSRWILVTYQNVPGWVSARFMTYLDTPLRKLPIIG